METFSLKWTREQSDETFKALIANGTTTPETAYIAGKMFDLNPDTPVIALMAGRIAVAAARKLTYSEMLAAMPSALDSLYWEKIIEARDRKTFLNILSTGVAIAKQCRAQGERVVNKTVTPLDALGNAGESAVAYWGRAHRNSLSAPINPEVIIRPATLIAAEEYTEEEENVWAHAVWSRVSRMIDEQHADQELNDIVAAAMA